MAHLGRNEHDNRFRLAQKTLSLPSSMLWRRMRVGGLANKSRFPTK
jgi:hypothetical protein